MRQAERRNLLPRTFMVLIMIVFVCGDHSSINLAFSLFLSLFSPAKTMLSGGAPRRDIHQRGEFPADSGDGVGRVAVAAENDTSPRTGAGEEGGGGGYPSRRKSRHKRRVKTSPIVPAWRR